MKKYIKRIRKHFREVLKTKTGENSIALGFAIGTFIAILPTYDLASFWACLFIRKVSCWKSYYSCFSFSNLIFFGQTNP
jgi:hypothetical protein